MSSRDDQIDRMAGMLKEWSSEIDKMEAKMQSASEGAKQELTSQIADFRERRANMEAQFQKSREASEAAFADMQEGFDQMSGVMREMLNKMMGRF